MSSTVASVAASLLRVRNARRNEGVGRSPLERKETEYVAIFRSLKACAGADGLEVVTDWIVEHIQTNRRVPEPTAVETRARTLCTEWDVTVPADPPFSQ